MTIVVPLDGVFHHEDLVVGAQLTAGAYDVTRAAIIAFAAAYDPQPMHLNEAAAKASIVGGLCASGLHTCAIMMRLLCDHFLLRSASLGSPGLDDCQWLQPVRPGDQLAVRITVLETRLLRSRPDVGISKIRFELLDGNGTPVLSAITNQLTRRRHPGPPMPPAERKPPTAAPPLETLWGGPSGATFAMRGNYFEDQIVGEVCDLGEHVFGRDEIIEFARQFDPQPFHLDEAAGQRSLFGGLAASGWHTAAIFIRQLVRTRQAQEAALRAAGQSLANWGPSPGFRNLSWLKPVLAGDRLEFRTKTIERRALKSRPDRGLVVSLAEGRNQRGEIAYRFTGQVFVERRHRD